MLSKKIKKSIIQAVVMAIMTVTGTALYNTIVPSEIALAATVGEVTVKASSLWTYSRADWSARSKVYSRGQKFSVVEKITLSDGVMYRLTNGLYISANPKYVDYKGVMPTTGTTSTSKTFQTTANLNMRTGASTSYSITLTIPKGQNVEFVATAASGWYQVKYSGKTGFVSSRYVKEVSGGVVAPTPTPAPTPSPTPTPTPTPTSKTYKNTVPLNMRSGDSVSHGVIQVLPQSSTLEYISTAPSGWYQVKYNGKTGFVSSKYVTAVTVSTPTPTPTPTPAPPANTVSGATVKVRLNLREGDGTNFRVLTTMPADAKVSVIKRGDLWSQIKYNNITGYAYNKYLDFTTIPGTGSVAPTPVPEPTPTPTPTPTPAPTPPTSNSGDYVSNTGKNLIIENVAGSPIIPLSQVSEYEVKTKIALNMRGGAGLEHNVLVTIPKHVSMKREELLDNGWAKVTYEGKTGYVNTSESYISTIPVVWREDTEWAKLKRDTANKSLGVSAIENALLQLTKEYQWGAEGSVDYDRDGDVRPGFDCSGLTQWAFYESGKMIPRTTATGYNVSNKVSVPNIQIGDLIYFNPPSSIAPVSHVGMYMGNNMMLHASGSFKMTTISEVYWDRVVSVIRY